MQFLSCSGDLALTCLWMRNKSYPACHIILTKKKCVTAIFLTFLKALYRKANGSGFVLHHSYYAGRNVLRMRGGQRRTARLVWAELFTTPLSRKASSEGHIESKNSQKQEADATVRLGFPQTRHMKWKKTRQCFSNFSTPFNKTVVPAENL